jgi:hypothetical protein
MSMAAVAAALKVKTRTIPDRPAVPDDPQEANTVQVVVG